MNYTFMQLLNEYTVKIPIIQRDYAQGRTNEFATNVRNSLLKDIKKSLLTNENLDLSFVYGKIEDNEFIPIDGQQRLTTLFLLYLYAFRNDLEKTSILQKFTYETRISSRNFIRKLIENRLTIFKGQPSEEIKDSEWFISEWLYDPTVIGMLVMLDDIDENFKDIPDLGRVLGDSNNQLITFKFPKIENLSMEDSLYIKLNARGRSLTPMENLKAQLIRRIDELKIDYKDVYEDSMDTIWTHFFWKIYKKNFDNKFLTFFTLMLENYDVLNGSSLVSLDYDKVHREFIDATFYTLNYLSDNIDNEDDKLRDKLLTVIDDPTIKNCVLFHAITIYLQLNKGKVSSTLEGWLRILENLINNTMIDKPGLLKNAIKSINELSNNMDNIVAFFAQKKDVKFFNQEQVKEEQIKAQIVLRDNEFKELIYKAELNPYFKGQIRSALYLSKNDNNEYDIDLFRNYWNKIESLFTSTGSMYDNLLRQALLTFGDYTLDVSQFKTLCVDNPEESERTPSLKSLFSKSYEFIKKLLDKLDLNSDIRAQLENIISSSTVGEDDWRYCFIHYPQLFNNMSKSHLRIRELMGEMNMIPNKWSNGKNLSLYLITLKDELKKYNKKYEFLVTHDDEVGNGVKHKLFLKDFIVTYQNKAYHIIDELNNEIFVSESDMPIEETAKFINEKISLNQF